MYDTQADLPPDSGSRCQLHPHQLCNHDEAEACAAPQLCSPHEPPALPQELPQSTRPCDSNFCSINASLH